MRVARRAVVETFVVGAPRRRPRPAGAAYALRPDGHRRRPAHPHPRLPRRVSLRPVRLPPHVRGGRRRLPAAGAAVSSLRLGVTVGMFAWLAAASALGLLGAWNQRLTAQQAASRAGPGRSRGHRAHPAPPGPLGADVHRARCPGECDAHAGRARRRGAVQPQRRARDGGRRALRARGPARLDPRSLGDRRSRCPSCSAAADQMEARPRSASRTRTGPGLRPRGAAGAGQRVGVCASSPSEPTDRPFTASGSDLRGGGHPTDGTDASGGSAVRHPRSSTRASRSATGSPATSTTASPRSSPRSATRSTPCGHRLVHPGRRCATASTPSERGWAGPWPTCVSNITDLRRARTAGHRSRARCSASRCRASGASRGAHDDDGQRGTTPTRPPGRDRRAPRRHGRPRRRPGERRAQRLGHPDDLGRRACEGRGRPTTAIPAGRGADLPGPRPRRLDATLEVHGAAQGPDDG